MKKRVSKKVIIAISLALAVVTISGASFAWFFVIKPRFDFKQAKFAEDFHFEGKIKIADKAGGSDLDMSFYVKGDAKSSQKKLSMNTRFAGTIDNVFLDGNLDAYFEQKFSYFKFNQFPTLMSVLGDFKNLENRWARLDKSYEAIDFNGIIKQDAVEKIEQREKSSVGGKDCRVFKAEISPKSLQEFFSFNSFSDILTNSERNELLNSFNSIKPIETYFCMSDGDNMIRRAEGEMPITVQNADLKIEYLLTFSDIDKSNKLEAPVIYESVEDIYGTLIK